MGRLGRKWEGGEGRCRPKVGRGVFVCCEENRKGGVGVGGEDARGGRRVVFAGVDGYGFLESGSEYCGRRG